MLHHEPSSGELFAHHRYPPSSPHAAARINTDHVLESLRLADLQVGAWINVIGYTSSKSLNPVYPFGPAEPAFSSEIEVQATILWNARELDLQDYERALVARKATYGVVAPS